MERKLEVIPLGDRTFLLRETREVVLTMDQITNVLKGPYLGAAEATGTLAAMYPAPSWESRVAEALRANGGPMRVRDIGKVLGCDLGLLSSITVQLAKKPAGAICRLGYGKYGLREWKDSVKE